MPINIKLEATCINLNEIVGKHGDGLPNFPAKNRNTILRQSYKFLRMSKTFCDEFNNYDDMLKKNTIEPSFIVESYVVFCSFIIMNNLYTLIRIQKSGNEDYNVSEIYSRVFKKLREKEQIQDFHYKKSDVIQIYTGSDEQKRVENFRESFIKLIPNLRMLEAEKKDKLTPFFSRENKKELEEKWCELEVIPHREMMKIEEKLKIIIFEITSPNFDGLIHEKLNNIKLSIDDSVKSCLKEVQIIDKKIRDFENESIKNDGISQLIELEKIVKDFNLKLKKL